MKKILFIFNGITKSNGKIGISGGDIRVLEIIKNIKNFDKYLLTTRNGEELINKFDVSYKKSYIVNYSVKNGIISNLLISVAALFFMPSGASQFKGYVYSSCEHMYDVLPACKLKIFNKCKWYAVYHWVEDYPWKEKRGNTPLIIRYAYWLNRWVSGKIIKYFSDEILAVSDQTREKLIKIKKINPNKIRAVYCGVEYEKIVHIINKYKGEHGKKYDAVFMKRLNYGKGVIDLLEIWKRVCAQKPNAILAVIGDGPEDVKEKINNFIINNNLQKNIIFFGVIYELEKKFRIINASKLFILPSYEENWAIVIGEAMATKVPVIAYDIKEIKTIWSNNIEWVKLGDIRAFSKKILFMLDNKAKRNKSVRKSAVFIKRFDWKVISQKEIV